MNLYIKIKISYIYTIIELKVKDILLINIFKNILHYINIYDLIR